MALNTLKCNYMMKLGFKGLIIKRRPAKRWTRDDDVDRCLQSLWRAKRPTTPRGHLFIVR